ncbi:hypothetical protein KKA47_05170, partial [bacterium]|nr:hypothetical protein [bacterium]
MSLIHKALQKAQETRDKFKTEPAKVSSLDIKDEKEGSFGKNSVRSIALVAVLVVVLGVFAYSKFFPSKKTFTDAASPIPAAEVTGQVEEATNGSDTEMKNDIVELFSNKKYDKALKLAQGSYLLNPKDADI